MDAQHIVNTVVAAEEDAALSILAAILQSRPELSPLVVSYCCPELTYPPAKALTERRCTGTIKSLNRQTGFGYIDCAALHEVFGVDTSLHVSQAANFTEGTQVTFAVLLNDQYKPMAYDLLLPSDDDIKGKGKPKGKGKGKDGKSKGKGKDGKGKDGKDGKGKGKGNENEIFVGGLAFECTEEALKEQISKHGVPEDGIVSLRMPLNEEGKAKGIAFICLKTAEEVEKALKLDGEEFMGRTLRANKAGEGKGKGKDGKGKDGKGKDGKGKSKGKGKKGGMSSEKKAAKDGAMVESTGVKQTFEDSDDE
mmetsp:Transcript_113608/g.178774  ORF Transcript_113608/g.178774 Transcript_113608/m.178774 type:complete len:308 (-) Transcript_113608:193-1116(-)